MKIVLVYNPKSGSSLSAKVLRAKCAANNIQIIKLVSVSASLPKILAPYIASGRTIAAIGGDGTVSYVAGLVAGTRATLAPLPGGTLNHFTKDLKIPQNIDEAFARLATAKRHNIDVASVNGIVFVNNASIGIYPTSLKIREELEGSLGKWPAAVVGIISAFIRFQVYTVIVNGRKIRTPFVFIGNNDYNLNSVGVTNRQHLDKGTLNAAIIRTNSRLHMVWVGLKVLTGSAQTLKEFEMLKTDMLTIESKQQALNVSHDGEVTKITSPLAFKILASSLHVL